MTQRSLATCLCGNGCSSPLIDGVVGTRGVGPLYPFVNGGGCLLCSQRGVGHTWVLVVVEKKDICKGLFVTADCKTIGQL